MTRLLTWIEKNSAALVLMMVALVLVAGIGYSVYLGDQLRFFPDEQDYVTLADNLSHHFSFSLDGVNPSAFRAPGYPLFLAFLDAIGLGLLSYRIANYVILAVSLFVVDRILKRLASRLAEVIGVFLVIAYPVLFYAAGTFYPQTLAALLFLLALYFFAADTPPERGYLLAGIVWGALILTVPNFLVTFILMLGWAAYTWRCYRKLFQTLVMVGLILGIWSMRNFLVFDSFVLISTNVGDNLIRSYSENVTPNSGPSVDVTRYTNVADRMGEIERDRYLSAQAIQYVMHNPQHALRLYMLKVINFFSYRNELKTESEASPVKDLMMGTTYGGLLSLGVARLLLTRTRFAGNPLNTVTRFEWLLLIAYLANAFIGAIFFNRIRYRLPFDYLLILWVALFLEKLIFRLRRHTG